MALIESVSIPLATPMPAFSLSDPDGVKHESSGLVGEKGLLVVFTCNHCPYAIAVWPRLIAASAGFKAQGINTVAINPNIHPGYPDDAPDKMTGKIAEWGIPFLYLVDQSQETAKAFKAQCTPDVYLFNKEKKLVYHGRIDDNWQEEAAVTTHDLIDAVNALAADRPVPEEQHPSMGCSIKWK
ncbi:MAG: thioredoxin family protein [Elusimicrobia bacterium]|nr:MAG: thioredoxin family protein [Elusimicrobiota bacterium]